MEIGMRDYQQLDKNYVISLYNFSHQRKQVEGCKHSLLYFFSCK